MTREELRGMRKKYKLRLVEMAGFLGCSIETVRKLERGGNVVMKLNTDGIENKVKFAAEKYHREKALNAAEKKRLKDEISGKRRVALIALRTGLGMKVADFAAHLGIEPCTLSAIERGKHRVCGFYMDCDRKFRKMVNDRFKAHIAVLDAFVEERSKI